MKTIDKMLYYISMIAMGAFDVLFGVLFVDLVRSSYGIWELGLYLQTISPLWTIGMLVLVMISSICGMCFMTRRIESK